MTTVSPVFSNSESSGSREQTKHDVLNEYTKILNAAYSTKPTNAPTISDISKNFILKPVDDCGNVFVLTKKSQSCRGEKSSTRRASKSVVRKTEQNNTNGAQRRSTEYRGARRSQRKRSKSRRRTSTTRKTTTPPTQKRVSTRKSPRVSAARPVRINGRLALEAPPSLQVAKMPRHIPYIL